MLQSVYRTPTIVLMHGMFQKPVAKRELINNGTNKLYVRRNTRGTSFTEVVDASKSLAADRRRKAKKVAKPGQGDKGDR